MFSKIKNLKGKKEGTLAWNTLMLYVLTFSGTLISTLLFYYEYKVLTKNGADGYGDLAVAMAVMLYFQLLIEFGFQVSATDEVSRNREDRALQSVIMTSVTWCKLLICACSLLLLYVLCQVIDAWKGRFSLYLLFFIGTAINAIMPDYLYRGLEKMSAITIRTVCIRVFSAIGIILFLKEPEDLWVIPILTAIGNFVAVFVCFYDAYKRLHVRFCTVRLRDIWLRMKQSSSFFLARFATTAFTALHTVILDIIEPEFILVNDKLIKNTVRSNYASADKLMSTGKQAMSPISDSLYPYMVKYHDYRLVKKVLLILEPIIALLSVVVFIFAPQFCELLLGPESVSAGKVLRVMMPTAIVILPQYICGFPMLSSMGLAKHANYSIYVCSIVHLIMLSVLYFTGNINMLTLGAAITVTECLILCYRLVVIWRYRDRLKEKAHVDS